MKGRHSRTVRWTRTTTSSARPEPAPPVGPVKPTAPLTKADFPAVGTQVSQKQLRHIDGRPEYRGGGHLASRQDAQKMLDAYHDGSAKILGSTPANFPVVRVPNVTGGASFNPGERIRLRRYGVAHHRQGQERSVPKLLRPRQSAGLRRSFRALAELNVGRLRRRGGDRWTPFARLER